MLLGRAERQHDPVVSLEVGVDLHPVELVDAHRRSIRRYANAVQVSVATRVWSCEGGLLREPSSLVADPATGDGGSERGVGRQRCRSSRLRASDRDGQIRTGDPSLPKRVRYQAAPRPVF